MQYFNNLFYGQRPAVDQSNSQVDFFKSPPVNSQPSPQADFFKRLPPSTPTNVFIACVPQTLPKAATTPPVLYYPCGVPQTNLYSFNSRANSGLSALERQEYDTVRRAMDTNVEGSWELSTAVYNKLLLEGISNQYKLMNIDEKLFLTRII